MVAKMENEIKDIPDTGTRKNYSHLIFAMASTFAVVMIVTILLGNVSKDKLDMIMIVFTAWSTISGSVLGIYTLSETAKKHSYAVLNK